MPGNEVVDHRVVFLHTNRKNDKVILLVLIVGCPKLGCTGIAGRSPRMHKGDGYGPAAKIAQLHLFASIADQLKITATTVAYHVRHIYEKLDVINAPAAVARGFLSGILPAK